jgi:uncharacterized protein
LQRAPTEGEVTTTGSEEPVLEGKRAAKEVVQFSGHPMVRSTHPTTIEVTTENRLTERGDCIIGVGASKACAQLDPRIREGLRRMDSKVTIRFLVGDHSFQVRAVGDPRLELSHPHEMVIRRSDFISNRTLAVGADAAAKDIPRVMIRLLRDPAVVGRMEIEVA